jgi:hypothetical protein
MLSRREAATIALPKNWKRSVRSAVLNLSAIFYRLCSRLGSQQHQRPRSPES